jgi:hypothetical protein
VEILQADEDEDIAEDNTVCDILIEDPQPPLYVIRPSRQRTRRKLRKQSTWRSLPLYLSQSTLHSDPAIAQYLSPTNELTTSTSFPTTTIQHRPILHIDIPQSLPPSPSPQLIAEITPNHALQLPQDEHKSLFISNPSSPQSPTQTQETSDWTFITNHTLSSPPTTSEPQTPITDFSSLSSTYSSMFNYPEDETQGGLFD